MPQRTGEAHGFSSSKLSVLRKHPYFADLEAEAFEQLCRYAKHSTLKRGATIFSKGDPGISLFAVISGTVKISISSPDGRNAILNLIGAGEIFGEIALLDEAPRSATVITVAPTEFLQIARAPFLALIKKHPALALRIMAQLARGLRKATEQVRSLSMFDLHGRMLRALLMLAQERGETNRARMVIRPHPAVKDLAQMCGCTREAASRALKTLHSTGYVTDVTDGLAVEAKAIRKYLQSTLEHLVAPR